MSAKVDPYSNRAQAMKLNRAAYAFKQLKNAEKVLANAQKNLNRKKQEYHRISRMLMYPGHIRIRNNSENLNPVESRAVKMWRNIVRDVRRAGRTINQTNLPPNMKREIQRHIRNEHTSNFILN